MGTILLRDRIGKLEKKYDVLVSNIVAYKEQCERQPKGKVDAVFVLNQILKMADDIKKR